MKSNARSDLLVSVSGCFFPKGCAYGRLRQRQRGSTQPTIYDLLQSETQASALTPPDPSALAPLSQAWERMQSR